MRVKGYFEGNLGLKCVGFIAKREEDVLWFL